MRTRANQAAQSLAEATANLLRKVREKLGSSSSTPVSQQTSRFNSSNSDISIRSGVLRKLSRLLSSSRSLQPTPNPGSPMAVDNHFPPPGIEVVLGDAEDQGTGGEDGGDSAIPMSSPKISEWATKHHRVTVEEVLDEDACSYSTGSSHHADHGYVEGDLESVESEKPEEDANAQRDAEEEEINQLALEEFDCALPELRKSSTSLLSFSDA